MLYFYIFLYIAYLCIIYVSRSISCGDFNFDISFNFLPLGKVISLWQYILLRWGENLSIKPSCVCFYSALTLHKLHPLLHHLHQTFPVYTNTWSSVQKCHSLSLPTAYSFKAKPHISGEALSTLLPMIPLQCWPVEAADLYGSQSPLFIIISGF